MSSAEKTDPELWEKIDEHPCTPIHAVSSRLVRHRIYCFQLALEKASLASPDRIENIATRELGMVAPSDNQFVVIESYRTIGESEAKE